MKELLDFKKAWDWFCNTWKKPIAGAAFIALAFLFGLLVKEKMITDDCKFMGTFRDGVYAYNCSTRVR